MNARRRRGTLLIWCTGFAIAWYVVFAVVMMLAEDVSGSSGSLRVALLTLAVLFAAELALAYLVVRLVHAPERVWAGAVVLAVLFLLMAAAVRVWAVSFNSAAPLDSDLILATEDILSPDRLILATLFDALLLAAAAFGAFFGSALANKRFQLTRHLGLHSKS